MCTTSNSHEAIASKAQKKGLDDYRRLMADSFKRAYEALKPGRWMTVEFSNTQASVWNAIQTALQEAGFVVANVSALDKQQGSFKAVTTTTAVKQDLVISAYKPNGGLEDRTTRGGSTEESVWDFVRTHLGYLPVVKHANGVLEFVGERDPRILFDRMIAWFVRHNMAVPMSSQEFQSGLGAHFEIRDGMVFLSSQAMEYDKKRLQFANAPQMELFVADERSAIFERNGNNLINSQGDTRPKSNSGVGEVYLDYTTQPRLIIPNDPFFSQFVDPQFNNSYDYILSPINRGYSTVDLDYVWHNGEIFRGFELTTYWVDFSSEAEAKRLVSTMNRRPSWNGPNGAHALQKIAAAAQDLNIEYHMVFANTVGKVGSALKTNGNVLYFPLTAAAVNLLSKGQVPPNAVFCSFQNFINQI